LQYLLIPIRIKGKKQVSQRLTVSNYNICMSFFNKILSPNHYVGIDIGTTSIKVAEIVRTDGSLFLKSYGILENYAHLERLNESIQTSNFKLVEEPTSQLISTLLKKTNMQPDYVIMSVPAFESFVALVSLPKMPEREIDQALAYQAKQYIPLPIADTMLEWVNVGEDNKGMQVLLIAVPKDEVARLVKTAQLARLNLNSIELESISAARIFSSIVKEPFMIVDIGGRLTSFALVENGKLKFVDNMDLGGGDLTQVISTGMNIDPFRAEELKRTHGIRENGESSTGIASLMLPILNNIIAQTLKTKRLYESGHNVAINTIVLTGGGANLPGGLEYFEKETQCKIIKGNPFEMGIIKYESKLEPIVKEIGSSLSIACGLSMMKLS
jgi:type IV pilus assembly protein PilM